VGNANLSNGSSAPLADTLFSKPVPGKDISTTGFPGSSTNLPNLTVRFGSATKDNQAQIVSPQYLGVSIILAAKIDQRDLLPISLE
jgi:hypothetical protein